jgi:hypothetical protein
MEEPQTIEEATALTTVVSQDAMATWSEDRRKEYVALFNKRARSSIYILVRTAELLQEGAVRRFIRSQRSNLTNDVGGSYAFRGTDRPHEELEEIAKKRANNIFNELPQVRRALEIVNPDVAKWMDRRDAIIKLGTKKLVELEEASQSIVLSDLDQKMTLAQFKQYADDREKVRIKLVKDLNALGTEGAAIEVKIHKALFKGIPGLSEAIELAMDAQLARAKGMQQVQRRVEEKVMFGDSQAAQELLNHFKDDELELNDDVKTQMQEILAKALGGTKKQLGARKKA